jgi:hypothetical protein
MHDVFPPYRTVLDPGLGIEPLVPQNVTRIRTLQAPVVSCPPSVRRSYLNPWNGSLSFDIHFGFAMDLPSPFPGPDSPQAPTAASRDIDALRQIIRAMREQMEKAQAGEQQRVQRATAAPLGEVLQLQQTVTAMRDELDKARASEQQNVQRAVADAHEELATLRATVRAVRELLEAQQADHEDAMRKREVAARTEMAQLHLTIQELRDRLEKQHGNR